MGEAHPTGWNRKGMFHILSFDVEEYFQVEAAACRIDPSDWNKYQIRLPACVDRILELLELHGSSATFFVLGWVARYEPGLVRKISDAGHEIASHGMNHRMISRMTAEEFRRDLVESKKILEDKTGCRYASCSTPCFLIIKAGHCS